MVATGSVAAQACARAGSHPRRERSRGRLRALGIAFLLASSALAGCIGGPSSGEPDHGLGTAWPELTPVVDEARPGVLATFPGAAGAPPVAGLLWLPADGARTVLVGVPGGCLGKELLGPRDLPGYSTAHRFVATGRAFVSIDRPGVGESGALPGESGVHGAARALKAVADALRSGRYEVDSGRPIAFDHAVGFGTSCGAMVTEVAQGLHDPYDAIVATAFTSNGIHDDARGCLGAGSCTPDVWFHAPGTDPRIMAGEWQEYNATDDGDDASAPDLVGAADLAVWFGCVPGPGELVCAANEGIGTPAQDLAARAIDVPVLVVLAAEDRLFAPTTTGAEEERFGSDDVAVTRVADTGHVMLLHLSLPETVSIADTWLDERGF